jgi:preprotein translocase subunit SecG
LREFFAAKPQNLIEVSNARHAKVDEVDCRNPDRTRDYLVLIIVVLLQSGKAADLAGAFGGAGSQTAFGPRGAASLLSQATTWCAIMFMVCAMALVLRVDKAGATGGSVLEKVSKPAPAKTAPVTTVPVVPTPQSNTTPAPAPAAPSSTPQTTAPSSAPASKPPASAPSSQPKKQ